MSCTDCCCCCRDLAIAAYGRACDRTRISPFVRRGVEAGCLDGAKVAAGAHCGGKLDDISCVLCRCDTHDHLNLMTTAATSQAAAGAAADGTARTETAGSGGGGGAEGHASA